MIFYKNLIDEKTKTVKISKLNNLKISKNIYEPNKNNHQNSDFTVSIIDTETTGVLPKKDKIIEIPVISAKIDKKSGKLLGITDEFSELNDPGFPIPSEATAINGITDHMVNGKNIDLERFEELIFHSDLLITHNAKFDRSFIDDILPISKEKTWACSQFDIDWKAKGFDIKSLGVLGLNHGFYFDSHRALDDVYATLHLITSFEDKNGFNYMSEIIENAFKPHYLLNTSFKYDKEIISIFKSLGYRWNQEEKSWYKITDLDSIQKNRDKVEDLIGNTGYVLTAEEIPIQNKY